MSQLDFTITTDEETDLAVIVAELEAELRRWQASSDTIEDFDVAEGRQRFRSGVVELLPHVAVALVVLQGTAQATGSVKAILDNVEAIVRKLRGKPKLSVDVDGERVEVGDLTDAQRRALQHALAAEDAADAEPQGS